jgi:hypothetical protein
MHEGIDTRCRDQAPTRRVAVVKLGLAMGTAYMVPTVLHLQRVSAGDGPSKGCSRGKLRGTSAPCPDQ